MRYKVLELDEDIEFMGDRYKAPDLVKYKEQIFNVTLPYNKLIPMVLESIDKMQENNIKPKSIIVSTQVYTTIYFEKISRVIMDKGKEKLLDLNIIHDPSYKGLFIVLADNEKELLKRNKLDEIRGGVSDESL